MIAIFEWPHYRMRGWIEAYRIGGGWRLEGESVIVERILDFGGSK